MKEILIGVTIAFLSYILIAVFNISNEDIYNSDAELIFSEGGFSNITALIGLWLWFGVVFTWITSIIFRIIKVIRNN